VDLATGRPVAVLLTPEDPATLRLDPSGAQAEEIFLDAAVPEISYRIVAGDGAEIRSGTLATFGWAAIPIDLMGQRELRIQLKTESSVEGLPGVRVQVERRTIPATMLEAYLGASQSFNAAQTLHRSLHAEDLRQAIGQFDQAAEEWAKAGDLYGEALALGGEGESEIELSRYEEAKRTLDRALGVAGNNAHLRGWLLHLAARVLFDQWEGKEARNFAEEELRLGQQSGDAGLVAMARTDLVCVLFWLRDPGMGQIADQARGEAIAAGVPETLALDQFWKGWIEEYLERDVNAVLVLNDSVANFRRVGDRRSALVALLEVAVAVNLNGDFYSSLETLKKLDPEFQASGNTMEYGANLFSIGEQYQRLNQPRLAEMYDHRADAAYAGGHILFGRMVSHRDLCETEYQANETGNAVQDCNLTLAFARQFGDAGFLGEALYDVGLAERKEGNLMRALARFHEAVPYSHTVKDTRFESKEHIQLGELLEQRGKRQEALTEFQRSESLSMGVADPTSLLEAQYSIARWYSNDDQYAKANTELKPALEKIESARQLVSNSTLQASYFAAERKCYELAIELRMREFRQAHTSKSEAQALEMSEQSRARGLLDALSARTTSGTRQSGEAETRRIEAKLALDRAFNHRLKLLVENGAKRDLEANSAELAQALGDLERAEGEVRVDASQAPKPAPTMSSSEIERASLSSDATFFEFALGDKRSFLWVIDGGKPRSYFLPPRQQLEEMVRNWRALATSQERGEADAGARFKYLSARLSCALFPHAVEGRMTKMVIVPDGGLALLPFAALPEDGCSGAERDPLVVGHEITLTPSLSVFLSRKPEVEKSAFQGEVAIVADPVFDAADPRAATLKIGVTSRSSDPAQAEETAAALPRLLNTGYEASAIQEAVGKTAGGNQVFLAQGFDASVETILSPAMQNYRIWHLATHGVYDQSMPEFSGLVFSLVGPDGGPRFGLLKAHDIARLNVRAELVVLSACDSSAGANVSGEGVMGLSYSFLRAGAKQVISTLWSIDDEKSRELMAAFYKELMRNGNNAAAALRQSQLTVMRQLHSHAAYYWGGFELTSLGR
jgi:CHAT domain-containing protein